MNYPFELAHEGCWEDIRREITKVNKEGLTHAKTEHCAASELMKYLGEQTYILKIQHD